MEKQRERQILFVWPGRQLTHSAMQISVILVARRRNAKAIEAPPSCLHTGKRCYCVHPTHAPPPPPALFHTTFSRFIFRCENTTIKMSPLHNSLLLRNPTIQLTAYCFNIFLMGCLFYCLFSNLPSCLELKKLFQRIFHGNIFPQ